MKTGNRKPESGKADARAAFRRRTFEFGVRCIKLADALPRQRTADVVAKQLIRAATSVGANYRAAVRGRSAAEFSAKLGIMEEECDEALYWIEVLIKLDFIAPPRTAELVEEANEILAITVASIKTARRHGR